METAAQACQEAKPSPQLATVMWPIGHNVPRMVAMVALVQRGKPVLNAPVWDVTKAAPVHAMLAGVLASIALALLAVLVTRPAAPRLSNAGGSKTIGNMTVPSHVLSLLVLSVFFLLIAAVIWGSLAGHPS